MDKELLRASVGSTPMSRVMLPSVSFATISRTVSSQVTLGPRPARGQSNITPGFMAAGLFQSMP